MMNLIRKCFFTFVILGIFYDGFSQENNEVLRLSVTEAQNYAIQNNRTIQSAKIDIELAKKKIWETTAMGLPQFNISANYSHNFVIPQVSFGSYLDPEALPVGVPLTKEDIDNAYKVSPPVSLGVKNNMTFDFTLSQLIFSGEYLVGLQAAKVFKEISEKNYIKTEILTKESVANSYYTILVLGENIKVLKESIKTIEQTYNEMVKLNEQGFNEQTDVDQLQISMMNVKTVINSLEGQKDISIKLLKLQLGINFHQNIDLTDNLTRIMGQENLNEMLSTNFIVENSIDYQIMSTNEKVSVLNLKRQKTKSLPTITAFYRHEEQTNAPSFNFALKDLLGATVNIPIFSSGQRSSQLRQAQFDLEKTRLGLEDVVQGLILEYEKAQTDFQTSLSNYQSNKESMELSRTIYDKTIIKYHEGVSTSFELTQIQNQYLTSESNYYNSILSLLNAKAKLDRLLNKYEDGK